jgi:hypothetical protein
MKTLAVAAALLLAFVSPVYADIWDFSWTTDATAFSGGPTSPFPSNPVPLHSSGNSLGAFSAAPAETSAALAFSYGTPAGPASFRIGFPGFPQEATGDTPIFMPALPAGQLYVKAPGPGPGWVLHGVLGTYEWTGDYVHPDTFTIDAFAPGSGPDSGIAAFVGTGVLRGRTTVPAVGPEVSLLTLTALTGIAILRRRRDPS